MKSAREWGDFGFSDEQMLGRLRALPKIARAPRCAPSTRPTSAEQGKPRWGEKTPTYVQKMKLIQRALPEARFVHVIRDGRDVALSVLDRTVRDLTAGDVAGRWQKKITKAREDTPKLEHYMEIRYEDLILDTEPVLRRVCEFIELPWDDAMLNYHERSAERLKEMARALPAEGRAKELSRRAADGDTRDDDQAAERRPGRALADADEPPSSAASSRRSRANCSTQLGYPIGAHAVETGNSSDRSCRARRTGRERRSCGCGRPSGSPAGRPWCRARSGRRSTSSDTRRSSSPSRARDRERSPSASPTPSGTSRASPTPARPTSRVDSISTGPAVTSSGPSSDDQNDQFDEIEALRRAGVRTIGRFVWESFAAADAEPANAAYDVIYSLTRAEQERYRELGIESPLLVWGCHPELVALADHAERARRADDLVRFVVPGSFMGKRKPFPEIVESFVRVSDDRLRLLIRGQVDRKAGKLEKAAGGDPRVMIELEDRPTDEHLRQFAACDVCLSPSRWEGLGLPLYEAMAVGMPTITNDSPPMNEVVIDGVNGIVVDSVPWGEAGSGIPAFDPDFDQLTAAIEQLADNGERERLAAGARELRDDERSWRRTIEGLGGVLS